MVTVSWPRSVSDVYTFKLSDSSAEMQMSTDARESFPLRTCLQETG